MGVSMGTRIDFEKDRRRRIPAEQDADRLPGTVEVLERAVRQGTPPVDRATVRAILLEDRQRLLALLQQAESDAFQRLFRADDPKPHPIWLRRATPTLKGIRDLHMKLLYGHSTARVPESDSVIVTARRICAQYESWLRLMKS